MVASKKWSNNTIQLSKACIRRILPLEGTTTGFRHQTMRSPKLTFSAAAAAAACAVAGIYVFVAIMRLLIQTIAMAATKRRISMAVNGKRRASVTWISSSANNYAVTKSKFLTLYFEGDGHASAFVLFFYSQVPLMHSSSFPLHHGSQPLLLLLFYFHLLDGCLRTHQHPRMRERDCAHKRGPERRKNRMLPHKKQRGQEQKKKNQQPQDQNEKKGRHRMRKRHHTDEKHTPPERLRAGQSPRSTKTRGANEGLRRC